MVAQPKYYAQPNDDAESLRQDTIDLAMSTLGQEERRLVWMKFYRDMTLDQMIERTGMARVDIQSALQVALHKMRLIVEQP